MKVKHGSYTGIADIMFVASRPEKMFVGDNIPGTTTIGFTVCLHPRVQRQHQQHAEDVKGCHSHSEMLLNKEN